MGTPIEKPVELPLVPLVGHTQVFPLLNSVDLAIEHAHLLSPLLSIEDNLKILLFQVILGR